MAEVFTAGSDISRFLLAGFQKYFVPNWDSYPKEYSQWNKVVGCPTLAGTYDGAGNLAEAIAMADGADFDVGKITQGYQTTITAGQVGKAFGITYQAQKAAANMSNLVSRAKVVQLVKAMQMKLEKLGIASWDNAFTTVLADGVAACSANHPCKDAGPSVWDNLATGVAFGTGGYDNVEAALVKFANFLDSQANPVPSVPDTFKTHANNQRKFKALFESNYEPVENKMINNTLPALKLVTSHYLTSKTAWFIEDTSEDRPHGIFQYLEGVPEPDNEVNKDFKNRNYVASSAYFAGCGMIPNIGLVGSTGL